MRSGLLWSFSSAAPSNHLEKYKGCVLDALRDFRPIVEAVSALHAGNVIHRDIKPDNIFVASDDHLVLGDCGLAFRLENEDRLTTTFENVGTRDFQPPWSHAMRLADVQPTFDVFGLERCCGRWYPVANGFPSGTRTGAGTTCENCSRRNRLCNSSTKS